MKRVLEVVKKYWWILLFVIGGGLSLLVRKKKASSPTSHTENADSQSEAIQEVARQAEECVTAEAEHERSVIDRIEKEPSGEERRRKLADWLEVNL